MFMCVVCMHGIQNIRYINKLMPISLRLTFDRATDQADSVEMNGKVPTKEVRGERKKGKMHQKVGDLGCNAIDNSS